MFVKIRSILKEEKFDKTLYERLMESIKVNYSNSVNLWKSVREAYNAQRNLVKNAGLLESSDIPKLNKKYNTYLVLEADSAAVKDAADDLYKKCKENCKDQACKYKCNIDKYKSYIAAVKLTIKELKAQGKLDDKKLQAYNNKIAKYNEKINELKQKMKEAKAKAKAKAKKAKKK